MRQPPITFFNVNDFVPGLREQFQQRPLKPKKIILAAIPVKNPDAHRGVVPAGTDRRSVSLTDGREFWFWEADSLRALFRGQSQPPELGDCPEAYEDSFILMDLHALEIRSLSATGG